MVIEIDNYLITTACPPKKADREGRYSRVASRAPKITQSLE
jgi:hypothetical protein